MSRCAVLARISAVVAGRCAAPAGRWPTAPSHARQARRRRHARRQTGRRRCARFCCRPTRWIYDGDNQTSRRSAMSRSWMRAASSTPTASPMTRRPTRSPPTAMSAITDRLGNVAFSDHVVLTDHMREGVLNGFGALIGKNGRLAARQRPARGRHHGDRAAQRSTAPARSATSRDSARRSGR